MMCGWDHVPHLTPEMIAEEIKGLPPHEVEARSTGKPSLGAGAIYPVPETDILCDPFQIPDWMPQVYALDVGWNRTAALWAAWNHEDDIVYLYSEHYRGQAEPAVHAQAIHARGRWIPGVIDPAARGRGQKDGARLLTEYQQLGLEVSLSENALEAGILAVWQRLSTGRLKVFRTLLNWINEYRFYQRDEKGQVKDGQKDHLMDCTRYLILSGLSKAVVRPASQWRMGGQNGGGLRAEYDPFARL
jgi:hypothetical protein